jgi:hypothetical protein
VFPIFCYNFPKCKPESFNSGNSSFKLPAACKQQVNTALSSFHQCLRKSHRTWCPGADGRSLMALCVNFLLCGRTGLSMCLCAQAWCTRVRHTRAGLGVHAPLCVCLAMSYRVACVPARPL